MSEEWPMERVAEQFRLDVRAAFEKENAEWLAEERAAMVKIKADCDAEGKPHPDWCVERDSFYWEIYSGSKIDVDRNSVKVLLPTGFAVYPDFIAMFGGTAVGWSIPSVSAEIVDGEARVVIELILIDYWDDDRQAKWLAEKVPRDAQPT
jgi:hypothetical protein